MLVLEEYTEGRIENRLVDVGGIQHDQSPRPVQRLGDARVFLEVHVPQPLYQFYCLPSDLRRQVRHLQPDDIELGFQARIIQEQVKAAPLERLAQLPRIVRGQHHQRHVLGTQGAQLWHTDLKIAQHFQQEGLELRIGTVDLIDQQYHRLIGTNGTQQGAGQEDRSEKKTSSSAAILSAACASVWLDATTSCSLSRSSCV